MMPGSPPKLHDYISIPSRNDPPLTTGGSYRGITNSVLPINNHHHRHHGLLFLCPPLLHMGGWVLPGKCINEEVVELQPNPSIEANLRHFLEVITVTQPLADFRNSIFEYITWSSMNTYMIWVYLRSLWISQRISILNISRKSLIKLRLSYCQIHLHIQEDCCGVSLHMDKEALKTQQGLRHVHHEGPHILQRITEKRNSPDNQHLLKVFLSSFKVIQW